tara:strand:- start:464 stop:1162 length:699 start_codon:yes stop_codon:yes gene_type:complete
MIVNTRPKDLSQKTNTLLESSGKRFIHIPLTKIIKIDPPLKAMQHIKNLKDYDAVIFTSQSAVRYGAKFFQESPFSNKNIPILAIGLATQEALGKLNLASSIPSTFNSEGLANVIEERGYKKCLVFCGEKNPQILTLTDADIDTFPCYASHDEKNIDVSKVQDKDKLVILLYTHQSIRVLTKELPVNENQRITLIVASKRIEDLAMECGFRDIVLADSPHDIEMVEAALKED